jgi:serine/threonine-protein kinase
LGVVHRDIKPGNLFLPKRADGNVKVLDFGLAAMVTSELTGADNTQVTRTLSVNGSAGYAAPEQIGSQRMIDSRADIWGLGVVLYELVSGRRPFESASLIESLIAAGSQPAPPMGQVPPAFESLVRRCLEKDRELRFPNVAALAEALAPFAPPERANYPEYVRQVGGKEVEAEATQRIVLDEQGPPSGVPSRANPKPNTAVAEPGATRGETSSLFVAQVVPARAPPWAGLFAIVAVSLVAMSVVISHARGEPSLARQAPAPSTPLASSSMRLPPLPRASASSSGVPRAGRQAGEPEAPSDGQEVP